MTLGAYYAFNPISPISGLGQAETNMTSEAETQMQAALVKAYPIGIFVPWSTEISEAQWQDIPNPENRYAIFPVTAAQLDAVEKAASGQPVGFVAMMGNKLVSLNDADTLFEGTPYEFFQTQGVFNEQDANETPAVSFVYWGSLRDEDKRVGSYATLARQASAAGLMLVYPVALPIEGVAREQPYVSFDSALQTEQAGTQVDQATAASSTGAKILLVGLAVGAGFIAYRMVKNR